MPRPRLTEEERQAMRNRILDAADAVALESGPRAVSSRSIAEKMGTSHMVLYTYFENLEQVYEAMQTRRVEQLGQTLGQLTERARSEGADKVLYEALLSLLENTKVHPRMADMPIIIAAHHKREGSPDHQRVPHKKGRHSFIKGIIQKDLVSWGKEVIVIGQEQGVFCQGDATDMTETVVAIVYGVILSWRVRFVHDEKIDELYGRAVDMVMSYLVDGDHFDIGASRRPLLMVDDGEKE